MAEWKQYQNDVADVFRGLGFHVTVDQPLAGVRTNHKIDVLVEGEQVGFDLKWLVECKYWRSPVTKDKVLLLRQIVEEVGANRGFILSESSFQSGALEAANYSNISLISLDRLKDTVSYETGRAKLLSIVDRVDSCIERYWNMKKKDRIDVGLHPEVGAPRYMSCAVFQGVSLTVRQALIAGFPVVYDKFLAVASGATGNMSRLSDVSLGDPIDTPAELYDILDGELSELESRLEVAELSLKDYPNRGDD